MSRLISLLFFHNLLVLAMRFLSTLIQRNRVDRGKLFFVDDLVSFSQDGLLVQQRVELAQIACVLLLLCLGVLLLFTRLILECDGF